jgi:hypothetical protein
MLETLKRRKRYSQRNKQSRKYLEKQFENQSRIGNGGGISKKYKSSRGIYTHRVRKITTARYDDAGNLIGGGIFDYFRLKYNVRKIKGIIGKLNVLERHIKKEIDSYEVQANQFKSMAEKTAEYQTEYIIAKRRNIILKNYRKDTEEINQKTDKNVIAGIDAEIKRSDSDYKHAEKMVAAQYKEAGKDIKNFLYLSDKYQKELRKFAQIDELRKKVETYQNEIAHIRDKALKAEGRSDLGKSEKAAIAKYRANKADYDYVVSLTDQNLQTVRELQQRSSTLTATMEFYKNQFGTYKREGYESRGEQGKVKAGAKLKKWADLTDTLAASLLGVYDNSKGIISTLEEVKTAITKCRTELVTVPEYINKDANANAILWFEHDVEDMIKVVKELKKHFGDMKNEFYNQIAAENMYSNYNYNSKFLRVIEIRLKFYEWMISKAFTKDDLDKMGKQMSGTKRTIDNQPASGGYYNYYELIGGGVKPGRKTARKTRKSTAPQQQSTDACKHLDTIKSFTVIPINYLALSLKDFTKGLNKNDNACYTDTNMDKDKFIICIKNKFNRYLLAAYIESNILDATVFNANANLKTNIEKFSRILKLLEENTNWDDATKKQIAEKFDGLKPFVKLDKSILVIKSKNKLTDLFDTKGDSKQGANAEEKELQDYLSGASKSYMKEFLAKLVSSATVFYGVLEYDNEKNKVINNFIDNLPPESATASTATSTGTAASSSSANNNNSSSSSSSSSKTIAKSRFNDKLNSNELEDIKKKIESIKAGLGKYGIYPSDYFNEIAELVDSVGDAVKDVFDSLGDDKSVNIQIKGLNKFKEYVDDIKYRVDMNDINIDEGDNDVVDDMKGELEQINSDYHLMQDFYNIIKQSTNASIAKKALKELIDEYTKDVNDKESIGKIAQKVSEKPEYRQKSGTLSLPISTSATATAASPVATAASPVATAASPVATAASPAASPVATAASPAATAAAAAAATAASPAASGIGISPSSVPKSISNAEAEKLKAKLEEVPDWLKDLDTRSKNNKDYISNILIRIPNEYPKQYNAVKEQFKEMQEKIRGLIGSGNTLAKLSDNFQTMTTTLIDIKSIEVDLIDVKVKAEPKRFLGLDSYIPEPLSLEKKSKAREDTKKISELVKGMMQNTFFEDRGDKEKAREDGSNLFDKILPILSKDHPPNMSLDDQNKLRKPDALTAFLDKLSKSITSAGITSSIAAGQASPPYEIKESQMKFCRLINKLKDIVTDTNDVQKIADVAAKIGDCSHNGPILKKQGKDQGQKKGQEQGRS